MRRRAWRLKLHASQRTDIELASLIPAQRDPCRTLDGRDDYLMLAKRKDLAYYRDIVLDPRNLASVLEPCFSPRHVRCFVALAQLDRQLPAERLYFTAR